MYVSHFRCGLGPPPFKSMRFDAPATRAAAMGPKRTAAKSVGTREIETSVASVRRTLPRSATTAATARHRIAQGLPREKPVAARAASEAVAHPAKSQT